MRKVSLRQMHWIKRAAKMPLQSIKQVFKAAGASGVPQTWRCKMLQRLAVMHKPIQLLLNNAQAESAALGPEIHEESFSNTIVHSLVLCDSGWSRWRMDGVVGGWCTAAMSQ